MKFIFQHILSLILMILLFFTSCEDGNNDGMLKGQDNDEVEIEFRFATRTPTDPNELEDFSDYFKEGESTVLISQRTSTMKLDFEEESSNCYKYIYYKNDAANWDEGYNFKSENPLSWTRILQKGQYTSGYSFGALFYPRDNINKGEIAADQSDDDTLLGYDILGGWHSTSTEGARLTFRLYHLMCKLKVNLYIPLFEEEGNNGMDVEDVDATALSFRTDYFIEWGERSTEDPPICKTTDNIIKKDIIFNKKNKNSWGQETSLKELKEKFGIDYIEEDKVAQYSFEILFPAQVIPTGQNIFRFILKRGDMNYNYVFHSQNLSNGDENFQFESGSEIQLELYLKRKDNEIVLLKANLHDWQEANQDFVLVEQ